MAPLRWIQHPVLWIALALVFVSCSRTSPEMQAVREVAEAIGGVEQIQKIQSLTIEGEGVAPNLGQNLTPDSDLPIWKVTEYKRAIDLANNRMRVKQVRTAQFLFAGALTQRQDQGLDDEVGYNVGQDGMPTRTSRTAAQDRRTEMLHHPLVLLRAALLPEAKVSNLRRLNNTDRVDITTAKGDLYTLDIDRLSHTPLRISSNADQPNLGDVVIETTFGDWETSGGVKLPKRLVTKIDKYVQFDLHVSRNALDVQGADVAAPGSVQGLSLPPAAAVTVTVEPVGQGVWRLAGSGNHRSIVFEFDDHLVLFEAPVSETRTRAVIDTARSLKPDKPLTHVVVSHHHFDHSGGLRIAVAEGLTVITHRSNVEFFKQLVSRPHAIAPDALALKPKEMKIEVVEDELTLKDKSMEVRLYHVKNNPREGTNLFAYVPRDRMLVQADLYDSGWQQHPWGDNLPFNVALHKLQVEKSVPVHGDMQSYADVLKTIASKKGS